MTLEEAIQLQFRITDITTRYFRGSEVLSLGDLGVVKGQNKPSFTIKVENVIKDIFGAEKAVLVRGSGTGALREGIQSLVRPGETVLIHDAPVYPTTQNTFENMGIRTVKADYNDEKKIREVLSHQKIDTALIQYTRQKPSDHYDMKNVIRIMKEMNPDIRIITDDNYAIFKVREIGIQSGADLSAFSSFKLLGPEGVGILVGREKYINEVIRKNYSGGGQVQGHEAMAVLRGLVYAPVMIAIQNNVLSETKARLDKGEVHGVRASYIANAQSKVLLGEFESEISEAVLAEAEKLGAAPHPVGAESKYEFVPMFYRVSGTFRAFDEHIEKRMIRINPMRSGADTIIRILKESMENAEGR
ncbi:MAG TPA: aminotransferase [Clostridiaceae bacterium]|nr:aminotransferase [Clostridiaceae bacterium]